MTRLALTDFRNYRAARLDLDAGPVVLTGPNGAGKTNLLEAVSFLSPGRGLRSAKLSEIDRRGRRRGLGAGRLGGRRDLATRRRPGRGSAPAARPASGGERRIVRIDGAPAKTQAALAERLGVLWLTPQMDRLFIEGPGARRRFLDRLVLGSRSRRMRRGSPLMSRRCASGRVCCATGRADAAWLAALEEMMARARRRHRGGAARRGRAARPGLRRRRRAPSRMPG